MHESPHYGHILGQTLYAAKDFLGHSLIPSKRSDWTASAPVASSAASFRLTVINMAKRVLWLPVKLTFSEKKEHVFSCFAL